MKRLPTVLSSEGSVKLSAKRVITLILTITYVAVVIAHVFFGIQIDSEIYNGLVEVIVWALGFIGSEQFASAIMQRRNRSNRYEPNNEHDLPPRPGGNEREEF